LIVFDDEVVMGVTRLDYVVSKVALSQEGIGGNIFVLNIDGIQQGNRGFDFVGAFERIVTVYGQGSDFFWV